MALRVALKVDRRNVFNASVVNVAGGDMARFDEFAKPSRSLNVKFIVIRPWCWHAQSVTHASVLGNQSRYDYFQQMGETTMRDTIRKSANRYGRNPQVLKLEKELADWRGIAISAGKIRDEYWQQLSAEREENKRLVSVNNDLTKDKTALQEQIRKMIDPNGTCSVT
jgi:hypothetical protein